MDEFLTSSDISYWYEMEKTSWNQDVLLCGSPSIEFFTYTKTGGDPISGIAPTKVKTTANTFTCSWRSPTEEEIQRGYMSPKDRYVAFYVSSENEFPLQNYMATLDGYNWKIEDITSFASLRCEVVLSPNVEDEDA